MPRSLPAFLLIAALLAGSMLPLVLAEEGKQKTTTTPAARGENGDTRADPADQRGASEKQRSEDRPAATGKFTLSSTSQRVSGSFVSFNYSESGLQDFALGAYPLFDASVSGQSQEDDDARFGVEAHGAEVRVRTPVFDLIVHDNPGAVTKLMTHGVITLALAPGVLAQEGKDDLVEFTVGNVSGTIRGQDLALVGSTLTSTDRVLVFLDEPRGDFDVHRSDINEGVAAGHVGVEASFNKPGGTVEEDVVSYGNVTMQTIKAEKGNLTLQVEGHGFDGRVLVLNVDGRVVGASKADDLQVLFDNASIARADNITDVLDADNDGLKAEYYVVFDPTKEVFQLIVSVPHYSVHTLSVTTAIVLPPPSVILGVVAGAIILVPSAFLLFRRKA
ncbi:MAG: hypothetical protein WDA16_12920 [Candidatus Thermoplasmatota archaeon]